MKQTLLLILFFLPLSCFGQAQWQCISGHMGCDTWRMEVPAGWIILNSNSYNSESMTFVPDTGHTWKV